MARLLTRATLGRALVLAMWVVGGRAEAERCLEIAVRLKPDGAPPLAVDAGSEIELAVGWRGSLELAQVGGPTRVGLAWRIGDLEPGQGGPMRVEPQVRQDVEAGRVRLLAAEPGSFALSFALVGAERDGVFAGVPSECRAGVVTLRVVDPAGTPVVELPDPRPAAEGVDRRRAAEALTALLYRAILRRPLAGEVDPAHVEAIAGGGLDGAVAVAGALLASPELRRSAVRRAVAERPTVGLRRRESPAEARRVLLDAIHASLFGPTARVDPATAANHERLLAACLAGSEDGETPCDDLAARLVGDPAFRQAQDLELARLATR